MLALAKERIEVKTFFDRHHLGDAGCLPTSVVARLDIHPTQTTFTSDVVVSTITRTPAITLTPTIVPTIMLTPMLPAIPTAKRRILEAGYTGEPTDEIIYGSTTKTA